MNNTLSANTGVAILIIYGIAMFFLSLWVVRGRRQTKAEFLLASRSVGIIPGAMSIAASWIWAPALFVSSSKTYQQGLAGLFWYLAPNVATLMIFGPFAAKLRTRLPDGYTLPQHMRNEYGSGVHVLYLIQFFGLQICCFAVEIFAGATLMHLITGLSFVSVALSLIGIVLAYAVMGGLRASVATDYVQMAAMIVICGLVVPWAVAKAGGLSVILAGLGGLNGAYVDPNNPTSPSYSYANPLNPWVIWSFGISNTISLFSGPLGDQMQWQRAFALRSQGTVKRTFFLAALLFGSVPLALSNLGFIASNKEISSGWNITDPQMVGPITVAHLLPHMMIVIYVIMILSGLCATLDSVLCAIASLTTTDVFGYQSEKAEKDQQAVFISRWAMIVGAFLGFIVAYVWHALHLTILDLFLFYGTLRASTMIPTVVTLLWPGLRPGVIFATILASLLFGAPLMAAARLSNDEHVKAILSVAGSLAVVTIGIVGCWIAKRFRQTQL